MTSLLKRKPRRYYAKPSAELAEEEELPAWLFQAAGDECDHRLAMRIW
jgi:hypothetical protein